ncbi:metal-dependent transcriptional regulator [Diplocloster agilis]|uniref:Metal-dependent transcriptional regulator n=1 Tax=Diplocloster agilis TaxID=2850323 RepID=A0A949NFX0_9FIRM|nr:MULTISPECIES: metal-dependent transcriptional regulator [Lachnospiraceae]MBU9738154.1 metal-dependent transcriptional regulator [Diplocloster agilis]MBU9743741.1 metal-dependent transcriptional regulator [Diplocloster agilis]MCU6736056.1 metal-dependent transcriptional regulator [Suonthocola fibrivorans]SCJ85722.1 Manganese transport regulator [uncultured Clostridium sp.]
MKLQESGENYLETILVLKLKYGAVRSIDVANELSYSKPSVSRAVSVLKSAGHITVDAKGMIELTDSGREIAETIYERHQLLTQYLMNIGVDEKTAAEDACRIEHVISPVTFEKLKQHVQKTNR